MTATSSTHCHAHQSRLSSLDRLEQREGRRLVGSVATRPSRRQPNHEPRTFAAVATLAAIGGEWAVAANSVGRWVALALLSAFALLLIFPALSERAMRPLVGLGERLSARGSEDRIGGSLLLLFGYRKLKT